MPSDLTTVHVDASMASLSIELNQEADQYLSNRMCAPASPEGSQLSGVFYKMGTERFRVSQGPFSNARAVMSAVAPGTSAHILDQSVSTASWQGTTYALRDFVSDEEIAASDVPLDPLIDAGRFLVQRILNDQEVVLSYIAADYDNYPAGLRAQLVSTTTSWNATAYASATSDPLKNIRDGRLAVEAAIGRPANFLALSRTVYRHLCDHTDFSTILQYTNETYFEGEGIPNTLRGLELIVGTALGDTAAEGATASLNDLFMDPTDSNYGCAIIGYKPKGEVGTRGLASFIRLNCENPTTGIRGISVRSYYDEDRRGWFVEALITTDYRAGVLSGSSVGSAYMIARAAIP